MKRDLSTPLAATPNPGEKPKKKKNVKFKTRNIGKRKVVTTKAPNVGHTTKKVYKNGELVKSVEKQKTRNEKGKVVAKSKYKAVKRKGKIKEVSTGKNKNIGKSRSRTTTINKGNKSLESYIN
jgi:hypothetical protein